VAKGQLNMKDRAVASRSRTVPGVTTVPVFLLVLQVRLRRRRDVVRDAARAHDAGKGLIVANWEDGRLGRRPPSGTKLLSLESRLNSWNIAVPVRERP